MRHYPIKLTFESFFFIRFTFNHVCVCLGVWCIQRPEELHVAAVTWGGGREPNSVSAGTAGTSPLPAWPSSVPTLLLCVISFFYTFFVDFFFLLDNVLLCSLAGLELTSVSRAFKGTQTEGMDTCSESTVFPHPSILVQKTPSMS